MLQSVPPQSALSCPVSHRISEHYTASSRLWPDALLWGLNATHQVGWLVVCANSAPLSVWPSNWKLQGQLYRGFLGACASLGQRWIYASSILGVKPLALNIHWDQHFGTNSELYGKLPRLWDKWFEELTRHKPASASAVGLWIRKNLTWIISQSSISLQQRDVRVVHAVRVCSLRSPS